MSKIFIKSILKVSQSEEDARTFIVSYRYSKLSTLLETFSEKYHMNISRSTHKLSFLDHQGTKIRLEDEEEWDCALRNSYNEQNRNLTVLLESKDFTKQVPNKVEQPKKVEQEVKKEVVKSTSVTVTEPKLQQVPKKEEVSKKVVPTTLKTPEIPIQKVSSHSVLFKKEQQGTNNKEQQVVRSIEEQKAKEYDNLINYIKENASSLSIEKRDQLLMQIEVLRVKLNMTKTKVSKDLKDSLGLSEAHLIRLLGKISMKYQIHQLYERIIQYIQDLVANTVKGNPLASLKLSFYVNNNPSFKELTLIAEEFGLKFAIDENISKLIEEMISLLQQRYKNEAKLKIESFIESISKFYPYSDEIEQRLKSVYLVDNNKRKFENDLFSNKKIKQESNEKIKQESNEKMICIPIDFKDFIIPKKSSNN